MTVDDVCAKVIRDLPFYKNSGGGVTLSGGEPMHSPEFSLSLLERFRENGIHTAIETCGYFDTKWIHKLAACTNLFLFDYKETDTLLHKRWTGVDNRLILENLSELSNIGASIVLRCPIIPGINDRSDHFDGIANTAFRVKPQKVELMPYHRIGLDKAEQIGLSQKSDIHVPDDYEKQAWRNAVLSRGFERVYISK